MHFTVIARGGEAAAVPPINHNVTNHDSYTNTNPFRVKLLGKQSEMNH